MPGNRTQNQVPHDHTPASAPGEASDLSAASLDLEAALGDFASRTSNQAEKGSVLATGPETFNVSDDVEGTIITDTKRDGWRFSDAVKRSLLKWVNRKERALKQTFTDKTIATKKIASVTTRTEVVRRAATNVAPGDGVSSLRKTPQVTARVHRNTPVSSIRVKPKDIPKEIGDTKPRWKYIVETDEEMVAAPTKTVTSIKPSALLEAPDVPLLAATNEKQAPVVVARTYRAPATRFVPKTEVRPVQDVPAKTTTPTRPPKQPLPTPVLKNAEADVLTVRPADLVSTPPDLNVKDDATFERLLDGREEVVTKLKEAEPTPAQETYPDAPTSNTRRLPWQLRIPTVVLLVLFIGVVLLSNGIWRLTGQTPVVTPVTTPEKTLFSEITTITALDVPSFVSQLVSSKPTGNMSYRLRTEAGENFPARNLLSQFSGANHVEFGSVAETKFVLAEYPDFAMALGIMLQSEVALDASLRALLILPPGTYTFIDRTIEGIPTRVATQNGVDVLFYHVTPDGTVLITTTQSALLLLIDALK